MIKFGFVEHKKVINIYKKTSIAVVCSRWEEPFGRTSLEATANGCAVIISNKGGLPETVTNGRILKNLSWNYESWCDQELITFPIHECRKNNENFLNFCVRYLEIGIFTKE